MAARAANEGGGGAGRARLLALIANLERIHGAASETATPDHPQRQHVDGLGQGLTRLRAVAESDEAQIAAVLSAFTAPRLEAAHAQVEQEGGGTANSSLQVAQTAPAGIAASPLAVSDPADPAELEAERNAAAVSNSSLSAEQAAPREIAHRDFGASLVAAGTGILIADAEASPVEAATGPPGWALALAGAAVGAALIGVGVLMSSGGRPRRNTDQNKQFDDAVREIEHRIGRRLTPDEIRRLHEALHDEEDPGFWDIVRLGLDMFGEAATSGGTGGDGENPDGGVEVGSGDDSE